MSKKEVVIVADYAEESLLSLSEVCYICHTSPEIVQDLIDHDIVRAKNQQSVHQFTLKQLSRIQQSLRLRKDLEINFTGIAIILDLLDSMREMEAEINLFKKHYK